MEGGEEVEILNAIIYKATKIFKKTIKPHNFNFD